MKNKCKKIKIVLILCLSIMVFVPSVSLVVASDPNSDVEESSSNFTIEASSMDYSLFIMKRAETQWWLLWVYKWELWLQIDADVAYRDPLWYFTYHNEWYDATPLSGFTWQLYSESKDYSIWNGKIWKIKYTVSGKFYETNNPSSYYELTLMITLYASGSTDHQFGPFINNLQGSWRFTENWGFR